MHDVRIHPTADVSPQAVIGAGSSVWHQAQIREGARLGENCVVGKGAYIDFDVVIGSNCKLQNGVFVYHGATLADGVFLGPGVMVLNDRMPRAINPDGTLKTDADWTVGSTSIGYGASVGGGACILPGVSIGCFALVGAGSVVSRDVADYALVVGVPARFIGWVCACAARLRDAEGQWVCEACGRWYRATAKGLESVGG